MCAGNIFNPNSLVALMASHFIQMAFTCEFLWCRIGITQCSLQMLHCKQAVYHYTPLAFVVMVGIFEGVVLD